MEQEQIKEINQHISDALDQWQGIMLEADAAGWAYYLNYTDDDLLNALYIFNHVAENIAIKNGVFDDKNATKKMTAFRQAIKECFGFDTVELTNKVLKPHGNENNC